jgi:cytochrome c556
VNKRDLIKIAAIAAVLVLAVLLVSRIESAQGREETEMVREAVKNAAITCYAVEGAYPEDLEYLKENYRLSYNEDQYFVTYEAFAPNVIPDIWVTERGQK